MTARRDVIVLGWWAHEQNRIDYVHLLVEELGVNVAEAKRRLDESLHHGRVVVIPVDATRAEAVAARIAALGAEARVLSGASAESAEAAAELASLEAELAAFLTRSFADLETQAEAATRLGASLRPAR